MEMYLNKYISMYARVHTLSTIYTQESSQTDNGSVRISKSTCSLNFRDTVWELSCVEMEDNECTDAHMEFDFIYVHFPHKTDLKLIFSNLKIDSESIGGVVFPYKCTHLLLIEQFVTLTCKDVSKWISILTLSWCEKLRFGIGEWRSEKTTLPMDLELFFTSCGGNVHKLSQTPCMHYMVPLFYTGEFSGC